MQTAPPVTGAVDLDWVRWYVELPKDDRERIKLLQRQKRFRTRADAMRMKYQPHRPSMQTAPPVTGAVDLDWVRWHVELPKDDRERIKLLQRQKRFRTRADAMRLAIHHGLNVLLSVA